VKLSVKKDLIYRKITGSVQKFIILHPILFTVKYPPLIFHAFLGPKDFSTKYYFLHLVPKAFSYTKNSLYVSKSELKSGMKYQAKLLLFWTFSSSVPAAWITADSLVRLE
jgi:hypothetical protein